ncbi:hypothetical protein LX69_03484 [Breznakibacter xylanolyticus]|uniref:Uncharacterized protein n=1 Tax=Breznakibacter xylanolyticus TaxID=990 RepID=A0A2W7MQ11_9BACT|nr:hypothetical protein [Breznakibacter xylanolyticus]PZX09948.1 hypothetical protein LX69_03478 [Breznakibacter xylanolyticus]PZX09954.1 hypothetical protein LX69_03484 [Breznakibacter xylanolyticus]
MIKKIAIIGIFAISIAIPSINKYNDKLNLDSLINKAVASDNENSGGTSSNSNSGGIWQKKYESGPEYMTSTSYDSQTGQYTVKHYRYEGYYVQNSATGEIILDERKETVYRTTNHY